MKILQAVLLLLTLSTVSAQTIQLFSASVFLDTPSTSLSGSLRGGRSIYIQGIGFPTNPTDLSVLVGIYPCKIAADGVTPTVLSCETTDSFSQTTLSGQPIKVLYQNQIYTVPSTSFYYSDSDTPAISDVFPSASTPGSRLHYYAIHRVLNQGDNQRDIGDFKGLYVGDSTCSMFDIIQDAISLNGVSRAQCNQSPVQQAGRYNVSEQVVAGWAKKTYQMRKPSLTDTYFEHTVLPSISSVSPSTGFATGQDINIKGSGFSKDSSKISVSVDGVGCDIVSSTVDQINCRTQVKQTSDSSLLSLSSGATQTNGYISGSGFQYARYDISRLASITLSSFRSALPTQTNLTLVESGKRSVIEAPTIYGSNYGQVFKGYFYAPVSGNYIFRGAADDQFILLINPNYGTTTGSLVELISSTSYGYSADNYYISNYSSTFSAPQSLQSGKYYYMECYHINGGGEGFLKVSVEVPNTNAALAKQTFQVNQIETTFTNDPEVLEFTLIGAIGGTFNLSVTRINSATLQVTYSKEVTVNFNASASSFQSALNQFDSYSGAGTTCTAVNAYDSSNNPVALSSNTINKIVWTVSVSKLRTTAQLAEQFKFKGNNLVNDTSSTVSFAQVRTKSHSPLISGTFTLSVGGTPINVYDSVSNTYSIYNIPYSVSATSLQSAFRRIVGFENVQVTRLGTPEYGAKWVISYNQYLQDVPDLVLSGSLLVGGLTGTTPQISFWQTRKQSRNILFNPIDQLFLFSPSSTPNVIVTVNGLQSVCTSSCSFSFQSSNPQVSAQSKDSTGAVISVTITDPSSPSYANEQLTVKVDGQYCTITSGTYSSFQCQLPTNTNGSPKIRAGQYNVQVFVAGFGYVGIQDGLAKLNYDITINSISTPQRGTNGGYPVTIVGTGFPLQISQATISLCNKTVLITSIGNTGATFIAPPCTNTSETITVEYNNKSATFAFIYSSATVSASLISVSPTSFSPVQKGVMTIIGTGFGSTLADVTVYLANQTGKIYPMRVLSVNDTIITCGIPGGLPGPFDVQVSIAGVGDITPVIQTANDFVYELKINSINPTSGPYHGGTLITITGTNFSPDLLQNYVSIGNELNWQCKIESLTSTTIQCRMPPSHPDWTSSSQGVIVTNKLIVDSTCPGNNCVFTYAAKDTSPNLTAISASTAVSGKVSLNLTGFNLNAFSNPVVVLQNKVTTKITTVAPTSSNQTNAVFAVPNIQAGLYLVRVRYDSNGQTNSLPLTLQSSLTSTTLTGSIKGGALQLKGYGLPEAWPSKLSTLIVTSGGVAIPIEIMSTSSSSMKIKIPEGIAGKSYSASLLNPGSQTVTATYTQSAASTPVLDLLNTSPQSSGTHQIQLNRTSLSSVNPSTISVFNVLDPQTLLSVSTWTYSGTIIQFDFNFKAGRYGFKVWFPSYGWADCSQTIDNSPTTSFAASANVQTSLFGGKITVTGTDISPSSVIKVGGFSGKVIQVRAGEADFEIPALIVPSVLSAYPTIAKEQKIVPAAIISDGGSNPKAAFDYVHASYYSSTNAVCYIGLDAGEQKKVLVKRIRYFPYYKWTIAAKYIKDAVFQGSNDGSTYTEIARVDQTVHAGWNSIPVTTTNSYRFIRLKHTSTSGCMLSEFEVNGIVLNSLSVPDYNDFTTDAILSDGFNQVNLPGAIRYRSALTPVVNSINPNNGTIYGGTRVTFTGLNLDAGYPSVRIDGVSCAVDNSTLTPTQFVCVTGPRLSLPSSNSFAVYLDDKKTLLNDDFLYVMRWSDIRTWGTDLPPVEGDLVSVPKGMTLLVDQSTPRLDGIVVQQGKLVFADERELQIHTNFITLNKGQFRAGTQQKPYKNKLTFVMYGSYYGKQQPMFGNKGIGCMECKFSMYGNPRIKTWTQLASTVNALDTTLNVIDAVDWKVGEEIVVASTDFDHNQAEQRTITAISGNTITVDKPFQFKHYSGVQTYGTHSLPMRAEVGLLTRNIKMMGDPTSEEGEYGSHLMMAGTSENGMVSTIAYTEFTHCGQPRIVGRYCMHFHMNGDVADSIVRGNAVHHSFARILTLHGVRYLTAQKNVGYRVKGHNFFVEDGIQTNNLIQDNLVIGSLQSWNMMQTDISVASYWITNPTNDVRRNRAAGGDFYGFWYEIKPHPDGPSATLDVCPIGNPLGLSHDNIAHSYKRFGLRIFKLQSRTFPCAPVMNPAEVDPWLSNPSVESKFYNYVLYKNGQAGLLAQQTGNTVFQNFTIAESKQAGMQFYLTNFTKQLVVARDVAIIGVTQNNAPSSLAVFDNAKGAIGPRTSGWKMTNVHFYNFPSTTTVLATCSKCDSVKLFTNTGCQYFVDGITFNNISGNYLLMNGLKRDIIYNTDASFLTNFDSTSRSSATIVSNFRHISDDSVACKSATTSSNWDNALACDQTVTIRKVMFKNLQNMNSFSMVPMKIQKIANVQEIVSETSTSYTQFYSNMSKKEPMIDSQKSYSMPYITDRVYNAWWFTGIDFTHMAMDVSKLFTDSDKAIIFKFNYTQNRELYQIAQLVNFVFGTMKTPLINATLNPSTCNFGDYTHDNDNRVLTICASSRGKSRPFTYLDINGIKCRYLCPSPTQQFIKQTFIRLWSNITQWPQGRVPIDGENVTIPGPWTVLVDENPAKINFLHIDGDVIIPDNVAEANITANGIWIRAGSIQAGTSTTPFPGKINIQITGNKQDRGFTLTEDIAGNKLFVVHGKLQLYGTFPATTWTRAKSIVRPGDTTISLTSSVTGWSIGDNLAIGPSFSKASQHEVVTITGINTSTNTVTFTPALSFTHYGASGVTVNNFVGSLDTRAAVGHLSRKIKIISGADQGWGFQMILNGYNDNNTLRSGSAVLQGVQFINGGQYDTQNTVVKIKNTVGSNAIKILQSTFQNCKSYCLDIDNINNALVQNNVFFNARVLHVRAQNVNQFTFKNNLMIAATKRPTLNADQLISCYLTTTALHQTNSLVTSNVCQGSDLHGFGFPFIPCQFIDQTPYSDNTASSALIGFIFTKVSGKCQSASGIKAYACQIGQISSSPGTESTIFKNFMIADSGRAATLRFGSEGDDRTAYFSNSYISAISRPTCTQCYGPNAIECTNNFGVRMLAVTINSQTMPRKFGLSYDVICKQEVFDSKAYLQNIIFQNFKQNYTSLPQCSGNVIFKPHDSASDMTGSHHLRNVTCNGCQLKAMAMFTPPNPSFLGWSGGCGKILCTGKNNYIIYDQTGHLLGTPSILLANNSQIGNNTQNCTYIAQINGHHCLREDLGVLQYESIAPDFNTRIMWPVYLKYDGGLWNTSTNGWRQWQWEGNQPLNKRLARFVSVVQLSKTYNMTFQSQPPIDMKFQFQRRTTAGNNSQWIVVKIYYPLPNSIQIQTRSGVVKPITLLDNNGENPLNTAQCGSNKYFYQNYTIHFVVTGDKNCQVRVTLTNSIQLNARIDMDINDFFAANGQTKFIDRLCAVLGITDTSRVKVVGIYNGSVSLTVFIDPAQTTTTQNSTSVNNTQVAQEMQNLQQTINQINANGTLGSSLTTAGLGPLLGMSTTIYYIEPQVQPEEEQPNVEPKRAIIGIVIGAAVGGAVIIGVIAVAVIHVMRKRARISQVTDMLQVNSSDEQKIHATKPMQENDSITNFESMQRKVPGNV